MADIAKKQRTFEVYLDRGVPGLSPTTEEVIIEAGDDADEICRDILDTMIQNEIDSGWNDVTAKKKKRGS